MSTERRARLLSSPTAPSALSSGSAAAALIALLALVGARAQAQSLPGEVESFVWINGASTGLPLDFDDLFGSAVESLGDLDGDGVSELAVGNPHDDDGSPKSGAVYVLFMQADGSVKSWQKISNLEGGLSLPLDTLDLFGSSLARLGDLDGDGVTELAVGAPYDDDIEPDSGATYVLFLEADGTVKAQQKLSNLFGGLGYQYREDDSFGTAVTGLGDLDGDGVPDLAVGAYLHGTGSVLDTGSIMILRLHADGTVKAKQRIDATHGGFVGALGDDQNFGNALTTLGDLDGDGVTEIAAGAQYDTDSSQGPPLLWVGAAWIFFLNADGTLKAQQKISDAEGGMQGHLRQDDRFGRSLEGVGDLDGDGVPDLAVGAMLDGAFGGTVFLLFLQADGTVREHRTIGQWLSNFDPDWTSGQLFGSSITALGDVDGNGQVDLAVGNPVNTHPSDPGGAVYRLLLRDGLWLDVGDGLAGSDGIPSLDVGGLPVPGETVTILAHDLPPIGLAYLVVGASAIHAPFKGGVYVPFPDLTLLLLPGSGFEHLIVTWPAADLSGASLWMQAWMKDTGAPAGWAASNAVTVTVP